MPIIGTAGHVDHGKSTLVMALTGRDPDRWKEEKERGLTIDLGFAWTNLGDDEVGFVDVPGHERFIKNMLAGVGAIDVALFVVAADEGWMPQSEEHMSVLDLLGIRHGVIALTRTDLVDGDLIDLAILEIEERVAGTALERWPVVPVSATAGTGLDQLRAALVSALAAAGEPLDRGRPRLWVDRVFAISGSGLVVTGTLADGSLDVGDELEAWPGRIRCRIRGLHRHDRPVESSRPGSRTAVNVVGPDRSALGRGTLLTAPGSIRDTHEFLADVQTVRELAGPIGNRGAYRLHLGTGSWPARLRVVGDSKIAGEGTALIRLAGAAPAQMGDKFILRDVGRRTVVAGGTVLDPRPDPARAGAGAEALRAAISGTPDDRAAALLTIRGLARTSDLGADSGGGTPAGSPVRAGELVVDRGAAQALGERVTEITTEFHSANPLRPGIPKATLASAAGLPADLLEALLGEVVPMLVDEGATVRLAEFTGRLGAEEETAWQRLRTALLSAGAAVPRASELAIGAELLHALIRGERLVRVADDLVYLPQQLDEIRATLSGLSDGFTVAEFRDALGVSRRHAVPLLEYFDATGHTVRRGDVRVFRRPSAQTADGAPPR